MLPTFVTQPRGDERGRAIVVDWGGTNGRALVIELGGGDAGTVAERRFAFTDAERTGSAERVFDVIADAVGHIVADVPGPLPLGFVYSFPARIERIDRAIALPLTKGWRVSGLEGADVVALLRAALGRRGLDRVSVAAVANDTVTALVLGTYRRRGRDAGSRSVDVGLILGTGTNQAADLAGEGIRNLESGNFDGVDGVASPWDAALDRELSDPAPGAQRFEKMAAGHYLGEILRRAVVDVARGEHSLAGSLAEPWSLDGEHVSTIAADESSDLAHVGAVLGAASALETRAIVRDLARAVGRRSARLVAAALVGVLTTIDPDLVQPHHVAVDGSLYAGYPRFAELMRAAIIDLCGPERAARIDVTYVKDATSAGAAVIAAVASAPRS